MSLADFEMYEKLGEGAYSVVFRVRRRTDQQLYALKKVKMQGLKEKEKENSINEVRILASLDHPNIIAYKEAFVDPGSNSLCIVMEFADGGDLLQKISAHKRQGTYFQEAELWRIFLEVAKGLKALHDLQILHRDLKSANVFLFRDGSVKLGDMNVSKVAKMGLVYTQTGTPYYASPEVWKDNPYDLKSDIWSLGCVLYEAAALHPPFRANDMSALYKKVMRGDYSPLPIIYSADLNALIKAMLQVSPTLRPNCDKLLALPIVARNTAIDSSAYSFESQSLLGTIKLPRNLTSLSERLPAPAYGKKPRNSSMPLSSKRSLFRPNPGSSLASSAQEDSFHVGKSLNTSSSRQQMPAVREEPYMREPASVKLPHLKMQSPVRNFQMPSPSRRLLEVQKEQSLARQIEVIKAKYERVKPGIFLAPQPTATRSSVLPPWWG